MSETQNSDDDELDLREVTASLISGWKLFAISSAICASLSVVYAVTATPTFEAKAVFELKASSHGPSIASEYTSLASMAGISLAGKDSKGVFDRLAGRDFILRLSSDANLEDDPYFNPQEEISPFSFSGIKLTLGLTVEDGVKPDANDSITSSYTRSVKVRETKNGSIEVSVTHTDAQRSAIIANAIVARVVKELSEEERKSQSKQLAYLSEQLADALSEMEATKKSVADFTLANSLSSPSAFAARSELMFELREDLRRTQEMAVALDELSRTMSSPAALSSTEYMGLKETSPIIDDVDFRRLIGVPEALDAWSWPPKERLGNFRNTLADKMAKIEESIHELYASSTEQLATLRREATVAEATYNVLIEQVKAQSLITGYQGETALFYQSATPPERPTSPKKMLITALGIVIGLVIGAMISIITALRGGRVYTEQSIAEASGASLSLKTMSLSKIKPMEASALLKSLLSVKDHSLNELLIAQSISSSKVTIVGSTAPSISPLIAALWLALLRHEHGKKVAVMSLSGQSPHSMKALSSPLQDLASVFDFGGVDFILPNSEHSAVSMITSYDVHALLSEADKRYDLIILASSQEQTPNAFRAFSKYGPFTVALAKPGVTSRKLLEALKLISRPSVALSYCK